MIERVAGGTRAPVTDAVASEGPLEIRIGEMPLAVLLRTPGDDADLVRGFLFTEGGIGPADITAVNVAPAAETIGDIAQVTTKASAEAVRAGLGRSMVALSACGMCGKASLASLRPLPAVFAEPRVAATVALSLPGALRASQAVFDETGGLHAAGLFDSAGMAMVVREDVGRHNAVDKVLGAVGPVPGDAILCVSGRCGFEIVYKAAAAGIAVVVAVSAPTSLAIDFAERHRVTVCGFARGERMNIYTHPHRIA